MPDGSARIAADAGLAVTGLAASVQFGRHLAAALGEAVPSWAMSRHGVEFSGTAALLVLGALTAVGVLLCAAGLAGLLRVRRRRG